MVFKHLCLSSVVCRLNWYIGFFLRKLGFIRGALWYVGSPVRVSGSPLPLSLWCATHFEVYFKACFIAIYIRLLAVHSLVAVFHCIVVKVLKVRF
jgi:hypothetical protein